jgi:hypothetical protein
MVRFSTRWGSFSHHSFMAIVEKYIDPDTWEVKDAFLGLFRLDGADAQALFDVFKKAHDI